MRTIKLSWINEEGTTVMFAFVEVHEDDTTEHAIEVALISLIRSSWIVNTGDTIKIEEVT